MWYFDKKVDDMNFIDKLEKKFGRIAIPRLMLYITVAYAVGYILYWAGASAILEALALNAEKILHGQVWRVVTFVVQPPTNAMPLFLIITLYFYYIIGSILEKQWGAFKFNVYFFFGMLLHVIAAIVIFLVFGINMMMSVYYLNMSLFMAYALEMPNNTILLFFIIPFKTKWLAYIDAAYILLTVILGYLSLGVTFPYQFQSVMSSMGIRLSPTNATAAAISMLNFVIFYFIVLSRKRNGKKSRNSGSGQNSGYYGGTGGGAYGGGAAYGAVPRHRCSICGRTDLDDPNEEFRFCTSCEGSFEYCSRHIHKHPHVKRDANGNLTRDLK